MSPQPHHYVNDGTRDHRGRGRCVTCSLTWRNQVHNVADRDPEEAVIAARIVGERREPPAWYPDDEGGAS